MLALHGGPTIDVLLDGRVLIAAGSRQTFSEVYDASTNTFTATGSMSIPRSAASSARLADGRILVIGGSTTGSGDTNSAEVYDPAAGTWSLVAPPGFALNYLGATLLPNGKVLHAGGVGPGGMSGAASLYDPAAGTWTATGSLLQARYGFAGALLPDGRFLAVGGSTAPGAATVASAERYDPATGLFTAAGSLPQSRQGLSLTVLPSGRVLAAGGNSATPTLTAYATSVLYDPGSSNDAVTGSLASGRQDPAAALLPSGQVLLVGGLSGGAAVATAERYTPSSGQWSAAGTPRTALTRRAAVVLQSGQVLVVGGADAAGVPSKACELYDPVAGTWTATGPLNVAAAGFTATLLLSGKVLVAGGASTSAGPPHASTEVYDPATGAWAPAGPLAAARTGHVAALLPSGKVLVAAGSSGAAALASAELFDPAAGTWGPAATATVTRVNATATLLASGRVLVAGGTGGASTVGELYDPAADAWTATGALPAAVSAHTATLLPSGLVLLAGGLAPSATSTVELYDPALNAWSAGASLAAPRSGHAAVALPDGRVLIAGGATSPATAAELYETTGALDAWRPALDGPDSAWQGCATPVAGAGFRGVSAGGDGSNTSSRSDFPQVRVQPLAGGLLTTLPGSAMSASAVTVTPPVALSPGYYSLSVIVNGIAGGRTLLLKTNHAPVATDASALVEANGAGPITLAATDVDVGQALVYTVASGPSHGTLTGTPPALTYTPATGYTGPDSFTFTAKDCGLTSNVATVSLTLQDTTAPKVTCPPDQTAEATSSAGAAVTFAAPTATDTVTASPSVALSHASGGTFPLGATTVTATATDGAGNKGACTFKVTVADTTAPSLTCPANLSAPAIDAAGAAVRYPAPAAADAVTAAPQITVSAASGSVFPPGVTTVTATAKDGAGNQSTCSFKVTVTTTPGVTCPAPVRAVATSAEGALVEFPAPVVTDAAGGSPAVSVSPASGSRFPIGVTQVQVTATNAAGNSASCAFDVTVERPVLTLVHGGCASAGGGGLQALAGALFALWALRRRRAPRQARGWSPGAALPFAALVLAAAPALAGDPVPGFDLERLRLAPAATGSLLVDGGDLLPLGAYRLALTLGLEHGSLLADTSNGQTWPLVRDRLQAWLTGAWTPLRNLEVSAQLPVTAWQNGSAPGLVEGVSAPPKQGLGTPLLGARYALLRREEGAPVSLSLGLDLGLPGGTASAFDGESDWAGLSLFPRVAASGLAGPLLLGASAAVHLRAHQQAPGRAVGNELELAGSASTRGPGLRGELSVEASRSLTASYGAVELLGGVRYPFAPGFEAYALAGKGFTDAPGAPSWRAIAGVAFTHEPPPPPGPCEPGQRHQPEQCPALDDDGDGVPNGADRCPLVPGPADDAGCPKPPPKKEPPPDVDTDGDGVVDRLDKCPAQPGPASNQGCPLPDADGDGVPDAIDNCPREPGPASNQGCPLAQKQLVEISRGQLLVKEKISFANDKVLFKLGAKAIEGEGALLLQQIGKILLAHPEITLLTIAGHTDDTGPAALNRKLSQARADAVRDYLVKQGVEPQRLAAKGYGPDQPLAPNDTAEGRKENRRVEFLLTGGGAGE